MRYIPLLLVVGCVAHVGAAEHRVRPGEDPQAAVDRAAPGDRVVLLPGLHLRPLGRHRSILYVDKPIDLELSEGATLKLADHQTLLQADPEITTDHSAKTVDDLAAGGEYDRSRGSLLLTITIDDEGGPETPDTFRWAYDVFGKPEKAAIPITGEWQALAHGIQVRFGRIRGHNKGAFWFVSYDGPESYGIRIGHGTQEACIENVRIGGRGTIDLNRHNNVQPSPMVKDISACVLVHGRVRHVLIEEITLTNTMRSVMLYGEHTGTFLPGGGVGDGESYDAEDIAILSTRTINPEGAAYLLGHPSHRGRLTKVRCSFNLMESATTSLEPNFNLDGYEVAGNLIQSGGLAVHCWRRSTHGRLFDNVRIGDARRRPVVVNNAPGGWKPSEHLTFSGNINLQGDPLPGSFGGTADAAAGQFGLRAVTEDGVFRTLETFEVRPTGGGGKFRLTAVARSEDGAHFAAFAAGGRVHDGPDGLRLSDEWVVPAGRSNEAIQLRLGVAGADKSLRVEARGMPGVRMTWVALAELSAAVNFLNSLPQAGPVGK